MSGLNAGLAACAMVNVTALGAAPAKMSDSPAQVTPPPLLGEHTVEMLGRRCDT